ncbi:MAG: 50S ribosomal protein L19e [Candidatus Altiarchaeota archaeon]|nr:50S ribosomal protein L19e [Candidatus Altiarchaeota archaeon]
MKLRTQKRVAGQLLKCGSGRVRFDPDKLDIISQAITREDIRKLISDGVIVKKQAKGISRVRANVRMLKKRKGLRRGPGKRKGTANARLGDKVKWMLKIRAQRRLLRILKETGDITRRAYRKLYGMAKGNAFRDKGHLVSSVEAMKKRGDI